MAAYYSASITSFVSASADQVLGTIASQSLFDIEMTQRGAWVGQIDILQKALAPYQERGSVFFEYSVPRLGKRIDVVALIDSVLFVLEFKVGEGSFTSAALDQVWDYALDLKNFHETSHSKTIIPVLVATAAPDAFIVMRESARNDGVLEPVRASGRQIGHVIREALTFAPPGLVAEESWEMGRYSPTPTIIEAATALYSEHRVEAISRNDAGAVNLKQTSASIAGVIAAARGKGEKAICFVTGVPGAGKTLVGLDIATRYAKEGQLHSVFLSGNGPLVAVIREALARDKISRESGAGRRLTKKDAMAPVQAFIQNVHHFRDAYLEDSRPPIDHVAVFDEAQRAWDLKQTASFMQRKRGRPNFNMSEPEFLISCLDRHKDWAVVVCLVGGGQEINTGEGGISEWVSALMRSFPHWRIHISPQLHESEYGSGDVLRSLKGHEHVREDPRLHLSTSMRSFRSERVSSLVKLLLDLDTDGARETLANVGARYPIVLTRDLTRAKEWVRTQARGNERYGLVVSSQAQRLRPHAIDVRSPMDPIHWFLHSKEDVRSSYYLEDVATEFHVQGLELDWTCVVWDADFRHTSKGWEHFSFAGTRWNKIRVEARQMFLKNAYRVLLTRARQGMVIVVPEGASTDPTRAPDFYDGTYQYLSKIGLRSL